MGNFLVPSTEPTTSEAMQQDDEAPQEVSRCCECSQKSGEKQREAEDNNENSTWQRIGYVLEVMGEGSTHPRRGTHQSKMKRQRKGRVSGRLKAWQLTRYYKGDMK
jgi:hypothetical protein